MVIINAKVEEAPPAPPQDFTMGGEFKSSRALGKDTPNKAAAGRENISVGKGAKKKVDKPQQPQFVPAPPTVKPKISDDYKLKDQKFSSSGVLEKPQEKILETIRESISKDNSRRKSTNKIEGVGQGEAQPQEGDKKNRKKKKLRKLNNNDEPKSPYALRPNEIYAGANNSNVESYPKSINLAQSQPLEKTTINETAAQQKGPKKSEASDPKANQNISKSMLISPSLKKPAGLQKIADKNLAQQLNSQLGKIPQKSSQTINLQIKTVITDPKDLTLNAETPLEILDSKKPRNSKWFEDLTLISGKAYEIIPLIDESLNPKGQTSKSYDFSLRKKPKIRFYSPVLRNYYGPYKK